MYYTCVLCEDKPCRNGGDNYPKNCPTLEKETLEKIKELYRKDENQKVGKMSAITEKRGYLKETRIEETINFLKRMGYKDIGLAFCNGLHTEAITLYEILKSHGFKVHSVMCKNGGIEKAFIGVEKEDYLNPETEETMCNPIGQALFLNKSNTDINILLGLCVGHDSLFLKYSESLVTVIGVKDRVTCHNPVAPLYNAESYYKSKLFNDKKEK